MDTSESRRPFDSIILANPTHYSVVYNINPHMQPGVDSARAQEQWTDLRDFYNEYLTVYTIDIDTLSPTNTSPVSLPDFVFTANHAVPTASGTEFITANMATQERAGEPAYFTDWVTNQSPFSTTPLDADTAFEGMGDALWHPNKNLLWFGHGPRSDSDTIDALQRQLPETTIVPLELTTDTYYHLDTCFSPLSETDAILSPDAFTLESEQLLRNTFDTIIEPSPAEAKALAANVHVVAPKTVMMAEQHPELKRELNKHAYTVHTVDVSEFHRSDGSVFCMGLPCRTP